MKLSRRIVLSMLSVVFISGGLSTLIGAYLLWRSLDQEAQNRVRQDLNAARKFYDQRLETMAAALRYTALGERFSEALARKEIGYLAPRLDAVRRNAAVDTLCVADAQGRVIYRAHRPEAAGDSLADDPLIGSVLKGGGAVTGTILVPIQTKSSSAPVVPFPLLR